jgi:hypothetical protein
MQRLSPALLLAIASFNASAAWEQVSQNAAGTVYADPTTILRTGDRASMWAMMDYKTTAVPNEPHKSVRQQYQFDCQEMVFRTLSRVGYAEQMARGEPAMTVSEPSKWFVMISGSVPETLWAIACKRPAQSPR